MHYYDHYHDPDMHLQLTRQREEELLGTATRRHTGARPLARLCAVREAVRAARARAVRRRLDALEAKAERLP